MESTLNTRFKLYRKVNFNRWKYIDVRNWLPIDKCDRTYKCIAFQQRVNLAKKHVTLLNCKRAHAR